ncbi:MAG TPA: hypothetical protein V6D16_11760, partial [Candidatus Obscuribacterales bacterium]
MAHTSIRTISRDLKLFSENVYWTEIKICGGSGRVAKIDLEDFAPPEAVLEVWEKTKSKKKPPQMLLFNELEAAVKSLNEERRKIYDELTSTIGPYQVLAGCNLEKFMEAFSTLEGLANEQLQSVLTRHQDAKSLWLQEEIRPLLQAGAIAGSDIEAKLDLYASRFPDFHKIQQKFGVSLKGPTKLWSFKEALRKDSEMAKTYAEAESARAIALDAEAASERAEAEIHSVRTLKWASEQEARARVAAANAQALAEQEVYARACAYQEQQIKSAIDEKASELRSQVLGLLVKNLSKLQEKDYQPGKLPPRIRADLQALVESAQVLAQTDSSLDEVVG